MRHGMKRNLAEMAGKWINRFLGLLVHTYYGLLADDAHYRL
jgi:hypothetical protein